MAKTIKVGKGKKVKVKLRLVVDVDQLPPTTCWPLEPLSGAPIEGGEVSVLFDGSSNAGEQAIEAAQLNITLVKKGTANCRIGFEGDGIDVVSDTGGGKNDVSAKVTKGDQLLTLTVTKKGKGNASLNYKFNIFAIDNATGKKTAYLSVDPIIVIIRP